MNNIKQLALAVAALTLAACGGSGDNGSRQREAVKVEVTRVKAAPAGQAGSYSGTVEEESGTLLSFAVGGTVSRVLVNEGDRVGKGQLIATLDTEQMTHNHASARAALKQAEDAYKRMEELHGKGSLPEIKWVEAQTALERARASEQMARKQLADCRLYAPFSGVISKKFAEKGQNVGAGTQVVKLVAVGRMKVKIAVPESEMAQISVGQKADRSPRRSGHAGHGNGERRGRRPAVALLRREAKPAQSRQEAATRHGGRRGIAWRQFVCGVHTAGAHSAD